jgi:hypothetical protein
VDDANVMIRPRGGKPAPRAARGTLSLGSVFALSAAIRLAGLGGQGRATEALAIVLIVGAVGLLCWGLWLLYRTNASLAVQDGVLRRTDAFGRVTAIPVQRLSRAVRLSAKLNWLDGGSPQVLFLDESNHCLVRIYASQYQEAELAALCQAAGIPLVGDWSDVLRSLEVRRRFPGSYSWWLAHPWWAGTGFSLAAVVVGVAITSR